VAERIAREAGLADPRVLTGADLLAFSDAVLPLRAEACDVFAEVEPNQKERLIGALRRAGIVLLEPDLAVLAAGIREGRRTFADTLKDVFMASSANFGTMVSMAGASLLLPFLPLLPKQILLTNLLTDLPEMTIATDRVDPDWINRPRRWDIAFIKRFMLAFGLVSSVFDYLTFAVLLWVLRCDATHSRTGWFVESVLSATLVVLAATLALPYTPLDHVFGFLPLPLPFLGLLALILLAYVICAEAMKGWFYRNHMG
jgi:Mg2+-importing ATPase